MAIWEPGETFGGHVSHESTTAERKMDFKRSFRNHSVKF